MPQFHVEVQLAYEANDESDATQKATELTTILVEAGYDHTATTVMDELGEQVALFGI